MVALQAQTLGRQLDVWRPQTGVVHSVFEHAVNLIIDGELWTKLVMNCAYNAISAVTQLQYRFLKESLFSREIMRALIDEVVAVSMAAGVKLPSTEELVTAALKLGDTMATATSSTAQDIARGRLTEIDSLNGYVARRGEDLGIPTPVNSTLHGLVKLLEGRRP